MSVVAVHTTPRTPLRTAMVLGGACVALAVWNPGDHGTPVCPTKIFTGLDCPLCGGLRCVAQLTRGHVGRAADHNLLVALFAPIALAWWVAWWWAERRGRPMPRVRIGPWGKVAIGAVVVAFTVVRNLPVGGLPHWLASGAS